MLKKEEEEETKARDRAHCKALHINPYDHLRIPTTLFPFLSHTSRTPRSSSNNPRFSLFPNSPPTQWNHFKFSSSPWRKKIYNLLRRKLQLSTPKYLEKLRLTTPNYAKTTTYYINLQQSTTDWDQLRISAIYNFLRKFTTIYKYVPNRVLSHKKL